MSSATQLFREEYSQSGLQVDADNHVIKGVKVLGFESRNNRSYLKEAIREALSRYEGIRVNIDHPAKLTDRRSWMGRIGKLANARMTEDGLYADLHYNPAHPYGPALAWAAQHQPDTLGLSHTAMGLKTVAEGHETVHKIVAVRSVDLVADPATTKGLFEDMDPELNPTPADDASGDKDFEDHIADAINKLVTDKDMSAADKKKKILKALKLLDDAAKDEGDDEQTDEDEPKDDDVKDKPGDDDEESVDPKKELARLKAEKKARQLCESMKVSVTETFLEALAALPDEKAMKALIEDRKAVVNKPRSTSPSHKPLKFDDFAEAIRR